jgi:S1-C subfamily serine protease
MRLSSIVSQKLHSGMKFTRKFVAAVPFIISSTLNIVPWKMQKVSSHGTAINTEIMGGMLKRHVPRYQERMPTRAQDKIQSKSAQFARNAVQAQFVRNAVQAVGPSVVRIDCDREVPQIMSLFSEQFRDVDMVKVSGTGITVSREGYILTNAHVVDNAKKMTITFSNGRTFKASLVASDEFTDLAVIKADLSKERNFQVRPIHGSASLYEAYSREVDFIP